MGATGDTDDAAPLEGTDEIFARPAVITWNLLNRMPLKSKLMLSP